MSVYSSPKFILRVIEIVFAIVAFSTAANSFATAVSPAGFMIFTGVVAFLLAAFFAFAYTRSSLNAKVVGKPELAINALWILFWFSASVAMAATSRVAVTINNYNASIVFGFFSFICWSISTFFSFRDHQGRGSMHGGQNV